MKNQTEQKNKNKQKTWPSRCADLAHPLSHWLINPSQAASQPLNDPQGHVASLEKIKTSQRKS